MKKFKTLYLFLLLLCFTKPLYAMQIYVDSLHLQEHIILDIEPSDRIARLFELTMNELDLPVEKQLLFYNSIQLEAGENNGNTVQDYSIQKDSIINLVVDTTPTITPALSDKKFYIGQKQAEIDIFEFVSDEYFANTQLIYEITNNSTPDVIETSVISSDDGLLTLDILSLGQSEITLTISNPSDPTTRYTTANFTVSVGLPPLSGGNIASFLNNSKLDWHPKQPIPESHSIIINVTNPFANLSNNQENE